MKPLWYRVSGVMVIIYTPIILTILTYLILNPVQNYTNMPKMLPLRHIFIPTLTKHGKRSIPASRLLLSR